jgi:hypothetical protein
MSMKQAKEVSTIMKSMITFGHHDSSLKQPEGKTVDE